jgi:hypothetical protein
VRSPRASSRLLGDTALARRIALAAGARRVRFSLAAMLGRMEAVFQPRAVDARPAVAAAIPAPDAPVSSSPAGRRVSFCWAGAARRAAATDLIAHHLLLGD